MHTRAWSSVAAVTVALCLSAPLPAIAQGAGDWPNKTVKIISNFAPGGSTDNSMRPYLERLSKALGQQFVLEFRGGASGVIGLEAMIKSPPDGYTFAVTPGLSLMIVPHIRKTPSIRSRPLTEVPRPFRLSVVE